AATPTGHKWRAAPTPSRVMTCIRCACVRSRSRPVHHLRRRHPITSRWRHMKRSIDRFLTTFAGSLIRPPEVLALTPETDDATRTATLRTAVADVVRKQVDAGVDVVSDGEFGKESWFTYVMQRLDGYEVRPVQKPEIGFLGRDERRYPDFFQSSGMGALGTQRHVCVAPLRYIGRAAMQRDVDNLLSALQGVSVAGA